MGGGSYDGSGGRVKENEGAMKKKELRNLPSDNSTKNIKEILKANTPLDNIGPRSNGSLKKNASAKCGTPPYMLVVREAPLM